MVLGFQPSTPCTFHSTANMSIEIAHRTNPTHGKSSFGRIFARELTMQCLEWRFSFPGKAICFPCVLSICSNFAITSIGSNVSFGPMTPPRIRIDASTTLLSNVRNRAGLR